MLCRQTRIEGLYDEARWFGRIGRLLQTRPKQTIDSLLEWLTGAAVLLFKEGRNILINGQSSSHIMMLSAKAS